MPKQNKAAIIEMAKEEKEEPQHIDKPKRTRLMTPEALEKLKIARELALKSRREKAEIESKHKEIKETFGNKVHDVETFNTLKQKAKEFADDEVKKNEIVSINKKLEDMYSKFDGFLQDREKRKIEKAQRKEGKKASQIADELPRAISQKMLEEEIKKQELSRFREKMFGVRYI
jgi:hypothetical protein